MREQIKNRIESLRVEYRTGQEVLAELARVQVVGGGPFPAVLGVPPFYRPVLYAPLALLHASLALRIVADVAGYMALRRWGDPTARYGCTSTTAAAARRVHDRHAVPAPSSV